MALQMTLVCKGGLVIWNLRDEQSDASWNGAVLVESRSY
jgi:hypothetical protein